MPFVQLHALQRAPSHLTGKEPGQPRVLSKRDDSFDSAMAAIIDLAEVGGARNLRISEFVARFASVSPKALQSAMRRQVAIGRLIRPSVIKEHVLIVPTEYQFANVVPIELWLDYFLTSVLKVPYYVGYISAARIHGVCDEPLEITQVVLQQQRRTLSVRDARIIFYQRYNEHAPTEWHDTANGRIKVSTPETTCIDLLRASSPDRRYQHLDRIIQSLLNLCTVAGIRDALEAFKDLDISARLQSIATNSGQSKIAAAIDAWRNSSAKQ
jgi:AbiEi antitoxin C-terminal domain